MATNEEYRGYEPRVVGDFAEPLLDHSDSDTLLVGDDPDESAPLRVAKPRKNSDDQTEEAPSANPEYVKDAAGLDMTAVISGGVAFILLVVCIVFLALTARCQLNACSRTDVSSTPRTSYNFRTFEFAVPYPYVMAAMATGMLGIVVTSVYVIMLMRKDVGTDYMVEVATYIREGSRTFLVQQYMFLIPVVVILAVVFGAISNARIAGTYVFGAILSALTGWVGMSTATRGNVRTAAAAQLGLGNGLNVAFRTGSVMGLSVVSLGLIGLSFCYAVFRDVRGLVGFSAGASTVALFARVAGGIYTKAADVGADLVGKIEANIPEDDPRNPATIADNVGDNVGDVAGMGADLFESFVGSISACAILGASLPYFMNNPYGMCVHNHLEIDRACIVVDAALDKLTIAGAICRFNNFATENYPSLTMWESSAMFIALPFMMGVVGLLASIFCTMYVYVPESASTTDVDEKNKAARTLLRSLRLNVMACTILVIAASAGLCWGLFGSNSAFGKATTQFQGQAGFLRYQIGEADDPNLCIPRSITESNSAPRIPNGDYVRDEFRPLDSFGRVMPSAAQVPWRLFCCIVIGLLLGNAIAFLTEFFTAGSYGPTRSISRAGQYGGGAVVIAGLGVGLLSTVIPTTLIVAVILGANELFGTYGVALAAVGMLSTLGVTMSTDAYGPVADNAGGIAEMAKLPGGVRNNTDALDALGNTTAATGKGFSNGSAILTAYALLAALVQDSGLAPSPRELAGTYELGNVLNPSRHISESDVVRLIDVNVIAAVMAGAMLPYVFGAFTLSSVSRAAQAMIAEVRRQFREIPGLRSGAAGVRPDHKACVNISARSSLFEMLAPGVLAVLSPLAVGFGLGQRALVGLVLGAIGSGCMLGMFMSNAGGAWDNAKKLVEAEAHGAEHAKGSAWHKAAVAGDTVGDPFKDTSGPAMNILIKLMAAVGVVAVPRMAAGPGRWWVGAVVLAVLGGLVAALTDARVAPGSQLARERAAADASADATRGALDLPAFAPADAA